MNERRMRFRVGFAIMAMLLIAAIFYLILRNPFEHSVGRTICIKFNKAPGVAQDTPIHKAGILIGRVKDVKLVDDDTHVLVTAEIDNGYQVYSDEECMVTSSLLTRNASLEFVKNPGFHGKRSPIEPGTPPYPARRPQTCRTHGRPAEAGPRDHDHPQ